MATLTIRDLPEETRRALKTRAAAHNRSMEAEVRALLDAAVAPRRYIVDWLQAADDLRGVFDAPPRSAPRPVELS